MPWPTTVDVTEDQEENKTFLDLYYTEITYFVINFTCWYVIYFFTSLGVKCTH